MKEKKEYLSEQLISYLGNKRSLLNSIDSVVCDIRKNFKKEKISFADVFSGSGVVARLAKKHSNLILANDLEKYSFVINSCYLENANDELISSLSQIHNQILQNYAPKESFISELYAPKNDENIQKNERVFYSRQNALILGGLRDEISKIPTEFQKYFIAPLLSEASIHSNTGGVFKGFYKDKDGVGKFGGQGENALKRILGKIELKMPIFSNFKSEFEVFQNDALEFAKSISKVDIAYFDPPYNQHPYGSNYFMLNLISDFKAPNIEQISKVSGIPNDWNRSKYNKKTKASDEFFNLLSEFKAKYLIISFNSEGFISESEFLTNLNKIGNVKKVEIKYPTYRASRNLNSRDIHVTEYLYIVKKGG
ncbi:DNA adenine methylase [Campylobacter hyointestinalis]|uniref:site-specific DNA-methyltransferase (adenine-specific) n=1 Tax=Campylobacter hyointestinalis TaxID=198 RepID=A0A562XMI0_CAMHY|nr:DNA adenine methylase [Campylobacter hyointestinalis]RAZ39418.1 DNA modification methylase [Campylobacter hyointestinalis subsp. lawsonii]TWO23165.1 DNA modification methylase [Campylobacter hyointestinalis]